LKNRKLTLLCSIGMILVLVLSTILAACAQETAAPGAPTRISPQVPAQPGTPATPSTPTTPAKPAPAPEAEVIKYSVQLHTAPGAGIWYDFHSTVLPRIVEERTNGRILMDKVYGAGELVAADQSLEACATGMVNFVEGSPSYWKGTIPVAEIETGLPVAWQWPVEMYIFMYKRGMAELLEEAYAEKNIRWMAALITKGNHAMVTKDKIAGLDDFQGKKVATFGPYMAMMDKLGGAGTYIVLAERYTAFATGVVDAALTTPVWMYDNKFYEIANYVVQPFFNGTAADQYIMNLDDWNALEPDLQDTFHMATREAALHWMMDVSMGELTILEKWKSQGTEVVTWSDADWAKVIAAAGEYWDEVGAKDTYTARALKLQKDLLRDLGRFE